MIKILWFDDFDNSTTNKKRVEFVSILGNYVNRIQENLNRLGNSKNNKPALLHEILKNNANPIFWYDGFINGLEAIIKESPFDFIILDADLPIEDNLIQPHLEKASDETKKTIDWFRHPQVNVFQENALEAGFTLYFYLIEEQGFPLIVCVLEKPFNWRKPLFSS